LGLTAEQAAKAADAFEADEGDYCQVSGTSVTAFAMSAIGPKRTSLVAPHMSAFGGKADMASLYTTLGKSGQNTRMYHQLRVSLLVPSGVLCASQRGVCWHDKSAVDGSTSIGWTLRACRSR